ncbi:hypothetical protein CIPAW_14G125800 [Carya illinoinensis]|uniref:Uncharacterized protein n=1 Tax=Carya illinoinensis TaxID=32201 RepID=A0A8T1NEG1_CARIL|nr:hypothetical protein CIPAW_14G125800 [Carya illinoinensis]
MLKMRIICFSHLIWEMWTEGKYLKVADPAF